MRRFEASLKHSQATLRVGPSAFSRVERLVGRAAKRSTTPFRAATDRLWLAYGSRTYLTLQACSKVLALMRQPISTRPDLIIFRPATRPVLTPLLSTSVDVKNLTGDKCARFLGC